MLRFVFLLFAAILLSVSEPAVAINQRGEALGGLPDATKERISSAIARDSHLPTKWVRAELTGSDLQPGNFFGFTVAISTETVVVASRYFGCLEGGAYVFEKPASGWTDSTQTAKLTGSDWGPCGGSGFDEVAISGDTIVAGPGPNGDTAYVFVKPQDGWKDMTETARLNMSQNFYGLMSLAISGNTVVVGYPNALGNELGAAAVFVEPAGGWKDMTQTAVLSASDGAAADQLGWAVGIDGTTVIASAPFAAVNGVKWAGAGYVFVRPPTGWEDMSQTAKLTPSYNNGGQLGVCVSISRGVVVAGSGAGVAYAFVEPSAGWSDMTPTAALASPSSAYGWNSVSISSNVIGVGADDAPYYPLNYGAMFAFVRPPNGWQNTSSPNASYFGQPSGGSQMIGYSVAVGGRAFVTGAAAFRDDTGIVYLFAPQ
jgi:hypothetical protein